MKLSQDLKYRGRNVGQQPTTKQPSGRHGKPTLFFFSLQTIQSLVSSFTVNMPPIKRPADQPHISSFFPPAKRTPLGNLSVNVNVDIAIAAASPSDSASAPAPASASASVTTSTSAPAVLVSHPAASASAAACASASASALAVSRTLNELRGVDPKVAADTLDRLASGYTDKSGSGYPAALKNASGCLLAQKGVNRKVSFTTTLFN